MKVKVCIDAANGLGARRKYRTLLSRDRNASSSYRILLEHALSIREHVSRFMEKSLISTKKQSKKRKKKAKKFPSSDRIELSTSRLTVGRANRLRHEDWIVESSVTIEKYIHSNDERAKDLWTRGEMAPAICRKSPQIDTVDT